MKIVVDAYAWVEVFLCSEAGERAREVLGGAETVLTPWLGRGRGGKEVPA